MLMDVRTAIPLHDDFKFFKEETLLGEGSYYEPTYSHLP